MRTNLRVWWLLALVAVWLLPVGCTKSVAATPAPPDELVLYNWEDDMPQEVLDAFTAEFGVSVIYRVYAAQEDAIEDLRTGGVYDVVTMESRFVPHLVQEGLLLPLDRTRLVNFRNISLSFRDLVYDPGNRYSIPYNWGTTGIVVRRDLVPEPVTRWADLWDPRYRGKVAIWSGQPREVIALTLKSLGYSGNSEDPAALEAALARLLELRPHVQFFEDFDLATSAEAMASGAIWMGMGYAGDIAAGRELGLDLAYVLPAEDAILWGDTFVIPATSPNPSMAHEFLNFVLRPEISAMITNLNSYPTANDAATPYVLPEIRDDPVVFPDPAQLATATLMLPLSAAGQAAYDALWERFMAAE